VGKFVGPHDAPNKGKVAKVASLFWSRKRCWHGEDVVLTVMTENVPDGSAAELSIEPKGGGAVIDTVKGLSIAGGKATKKYTLAWKDKPLPKGGREFVFKAVIGKLTSGESPVLLIDLQPPVFSE
jgi:hypothetical protein